MGAHYGNDNRFIQLLLQLCPYGIVSLFSNARTQHTVHLQYYGTIVWDCLNHWLRNEAFL
jgi:hypothetical protein